MKDSIKQELLAQLAVFTKEDPFTQRRVQAVHDRLVKALADDVRRGRVQLTGTYTSKTAVIVAALNLCAERYPKVFVPYKLLYLLVNRLTAGAPKDDKSKEIQAFKSRIYATKNALLRERKGTVTSKVFKGVRVTINQDDYLANVAENSSVRTANSVKKNNAIVEAVDVSQITPTPENLKRMKYIRKLNADLNSVLKLLPPPNPAATLKTNDPAE